MSDIINIKSKFNLFSDYWSPKVIAEMNDYQVKLVKLKGEFIWHQHDDTDEVFMVIEGSMSIQLENKTIHLNSGEIFIIKKGVRHKPFSTKECKLLIIEPKGVINTGDSKNSLTAKNDIWI